jgi:hypothetical protein
MFSKIKKTYTDLKTTVSQTIGSKNFPKILVINYNENSKKYNEEDDIVTTIFNKITSDNYDFVILCTQNSLSGGKFHIQHHIRTKLEDTRYEFYSKDDGTREANLWKIWKSLKNVRVRIWKSNNVYNKTVENKSELLQSSISGENKEAYNVKINSGNNKQKIENEKLKTKENDKVKITRIITKRYTDKEKNGLGTIIISLKLLFNGETFQYIICNSINEFENINNKIEDLNYKSHIISKVDNLFMCMFLNNTTNCNYFKLGNNVTKFTNNDKTSCDNKGFIIYGDDDINNDIKKRQQNIQTNLNLNRLYINSIESKLNKATYQNSLINSNGKSYVRIKEKLGEIHAKKHINNNMKGKIEDLYERIDKLPRSEFSETVIS